MKNTEVTGFFCGMNSFDVSARPGVGAGCVRLGTGRFVVVADGNDDDVGRGDGLSDGVLFQGIAKRGQVARTGRAQRHLVSGAAGARRDEDRGRRDLRRLVPGGR